MIRGLTVRHGKLCAEMIVTCDLGYVSAPGMTLPMHCFLRSSPNGMIPICQMKKLRPPEVILLTSDHTIKS